MRGCARQRGASSRPQITVEQPHCIDAKPKYGQPFEPVQMCHILVDRTVPVEQHGWSHASPAAN